MARTQSLRDGEPGEMAPTSQALNPETITAKPCLTALLRALCGCFFKLGPGEMLIEKDPSLEKSIQFALRQNLHEIGERCVEELKHFITEYDNSTQDFGHPILEELVARSKKKFF
ncbi:Periphilin-1 [Cricetulus griseus]|uniref:Periphilin-1 n=1 Tax=Cricetulus griseus TaxID=10029 RepID=G3HIZ4_CRIGR|nr:Periphilin-1 [Cricetulus griseus]